MTRDLEGPTSETQTIAAGFTLGLRVLAGMADLKVGEEVTRALREAGGRDDPTFAVWNRQLPDPQHAPQGCLRWSREGAADPLVPRPFCL